MSKIPKFAQPLLVAALGALLAGTAAAAPLTYGNLVDGQIVIDASYKLPRGGSLVDGTANHAQGNPPSSSAAGSDLYLSDGNGSGSVFFHTYGYASGFSYFGARASGNGSFDAQTSVRFSRTYTNTSGVAQDFIFSFNVDWGEIALSGIGEGLSDLLLSVKKNGVTVARDHTTLSQDLNGQRSCVSDDVGSGLAGYTGCQGDSVVGGAGGAYAVNLGLIGVGESFTLDYDIVATISGDLGYNSDGWGCEPTLAARGGELQPLSRECGSGGYAVARSGDPFGDPANFSVQPRGIPEPASLALVGVAAAAFVGTRRRRQQQV